MDKPLTVYAELTDPELVDEFKQTLEREDRTMKAVVERALREYIAKSKTEAKQARREKQSA